MSFAAFEINKLLLLQKEVYKIRFSEKERWVSRKMFEADGYFLILLDVTCLVLGKCINTP